MPSLVEMAVLVREDAPVSKANPFSAVARAERAGARAERKVARSIKRKRRSEDRLSGRTRLGNQVYRATEPVADNMAVAGEKFGDSVGEAATRATKKIGVAGNDAAVKLEETVNRGSKRAGRNLGIGLGAGLAGGVTVPVAVNHGLGSLRDRANRRNVRG